MAVDIGRLKDLVPEILSRLPVKSLMRFKCVEKSWSLLIKDPNFISKHLHTLNQINMDDNGFCLLVNRNRSVLIGPPFVIGKVFVSLLSFDQATKTCSPNLLDLTYNFYNANYLQMYGPFNGIYYLHSYPRLLINPSMRESKLVPETLPIPGALYFKCYNGFGFDPKTNDYKVVCITFYIIDFSAADMLRHAHVYALSCNCWREVNWPLPSCIHIRCQPLSDTFVQGASHWWASDDDGDLVLAFDMLDEMFRAIRFPEVRSSIYFSGNVAKFKEFIAVILCAEEGTEKQFDIWVMQDYGKEESWTKHLTIGPIAGVERPLGFWKYHFVFEDNNGGMVLYDNQTQENENLGFHSATISLLAAVYMESLVSLRGDTDDSEETQTEVTFFDLVPDPLFDSNSG